MASFISLVDETRGEPGSLAAADSSSLKQSSVMRWYLLVGGATSSIEDKSSLFERLATLLLVPAAAVVLVPIVAVEVLPVVVPLVAAVLVALADELLVVLVTALVISSSSSKSSNILSGGIP